MKKRMISIVLTVLLTMTFFVFPAGAEKPVDESFVYVTMTEAASGLSKVFAPEFFDAGLVMAVEDVNYIELSQINLSEVDTTGYKQTLILYLNEPTFQNAETLKNKLKSNSSVESANVACFSQEEAMIYTNDSIFVIVTKEASGLGFAPADFNVGLVENVLLTGYYDDSDGQFYYEFAAGRQQVLQLFLFNPTPENANLLISDLDSNTYVYDYHRNYSYVYRNMLFGDVDMDGIVTAGDARMILRFAVSLDEFTDTEGVISDHDNDGYITAGDARFALRVAVGLEKTRVISEY